MPVKGSGRRLQAFPALGDRFIPSANLPEQKMGTCGGSKCQFCTLRVNGWFYRSCCLHQMDGMVDRVAITMPGGHTRHLGRLFDERGMAWYPIREATVLLMGRPKTAMYYKCKLFRGRESARDASESETRALKHAGVIKQRSTAPKLAQHSALRAALKSAGVPTEQANCLHGTRVSQLVRILNLLRFSL